MRRKERCKTIRILGKPLRRQPYSPSRDVVAFVQCLLLSFLIIPSCSSSSPLGPRTTQHRKHHGDTYSRTHRLDDYRTRTPVTNPPLRLETRATYFATLHCNSTGLERMASCVDRGGPDDSDAYFCDTLCLSARGKQSNHRPFLPFLEQRGSIVARSPLHWTFRLSQPAAQ